MKCHSGMLRLQTRCCLLWGFDLLSSRQGLPSRAAPSTQHLYPYMWCDGGPAIWTSGLLEAPGRVLGLYLLLCSGSRSNRKSKLRGCRPSITSIEDGRAARPKAPDEKTRGEKEPALQSQLPSAWIRIYLEMTTSKHKETQILLPQEGQ